MNIGLQCKRSANIGLFRILGDFSLPIAYIANKMANNITDTDNIYRKPTDKHLETCIGYIGFTNVPSSLLECSKYYNCKLRANGKQ